ncbi:MAG: hypothetical protein EA367_18225 [Leptolyngbya sp. DLM2.Bin15]|nr:MAG: hypothetical protein EA367_18225 [Leptolyngbya sp. DLM2.Bin15]
MTQSNSRIPTSKTAQDLDRAVQRYRRTNPNSQDLYTQWQAIRAAALQQRSPDSQYDVIPGEDSY